MLYYPYKSDKPDKKFFVIVPPNSERSSRGAKVYFGASGYNDYPTYFKNEGKNKAEQMKNAYIKRHSGMNENWGKSGINTAGFWSRWLLWNKPTLEASYNDIKKRFL